MPTRWVTAVVGVALLLAAWVWSTFDDSNLPRVQALARDASKHEAPLAPALAALSAAAPSASAPRSPEVFEQWLNDSSSLRGVALDGAWDLDIEGRLHPTMALRRRFDQLLSLVGEASVDEITAFIAHDVQGFAGAPAAQRVVDLWRRYVDLQNQSFRTVADMRDRNTWAPALAERQQARRRLLGEEVAKAFYAEEDAQMQAMLALPATSSGTFSSIDRSTLDPAAAERLKKEEAAWADWERRLADAKREHAALQARAELSALQRDQAMEKYMAQRFDAGEIRRVRALLQMPGGV